MTSLVAPEREMAARVARVVMLVVVSVIATGLGGGCATGERDAAAGAEAESSAATAKSAAAAGAEAEGATEVDAAEPSREAIRVAAVSCETRIRDTEGNLGRIERWAREAAGRGADIVLFPECSIHGWWLSRENRAYAETIEGPSVRRLVALAGELGLVLAVGMTELEGDGAYLTHVLLSGDGVIGRHRKSSLPGAPSGGEALVWDAGSDADVFEVGGWRVGVAICYESVKPETCRALVEGGAEIILAPYANGTKPSEILDPTRSSRTWLWERIEENDVWYIGCDATPHAPDGSLQPGAAWAITPAGAVAASTPPDGPGEGMVVVDIPAP